MWSVIKSEHSLRVILGAGLAAVLIVAIGVTYVLRSTPATTISVGGIEELNESVDSNSSVEVQNKIYVDLSGAVKKPGVYELAADSRLVDLISDAGGFESSASAMWVAKNLNLSQKLEDMDKFYIPFNWDIQQELSLKIQDTDMTKNDTSAATYPPAHTSSLDLNTGTKSEILGLPGIGEVYAGRIIENRPYKDIDDFKNRSGLSQKVIDKIADLIVIY